jgi:SAM-dependent methyltransferase
MVLMKKRDPTRETKKAFHYKSIGRDIVKNWSSKYIEIKPKQFLRILDIGCASGEDLANIQQSAHKLNYQQKLELFGVENYPEVQKIASEKGIQIIDINIERDTIPLDDNSIDIVIANQFIEHIRDIFWLFSEVSRVIKPAGLIIVGVPNLSSFYNRFLLMMGRQPGVIQIYGPHVRGYTYPGFKEFIEKDGFFHIEEIAGNDFYPLSKSIGTTLGKYFPTFSHSLYFKIKRSKKKGNFKESIKNVDWNHEYKH